MDNTILLFVVLIIIILWLLVKQCTSCADVQCDEIVIVDESDESFTDAPQDDAPAYEDYLLSRGLDKSVMDSHNEWVKDLPTNGISANGSGHQTVLSGADFINPTVGLRLLPNNVAVDEDARAVPTETSENLDSYTTMKYKYGFF